ncbi:flagellar motor switch protein FliM [Acutalibacter muris]|jgi:flagellar motor switch protein FliM|uniref:Flagellar motor switch protein FliM n=1 Tax=Acutalibacter muris TaxID=1796620 RepID=A0A1Z2XSY0_9FIRM|nr:FliM/FliN family flagellar motor switch protein [Acutalibacter muris]ANU55211.1 flagellar motor switch protein FliM [Hungateiclostridiaceae bacterium KB18]ASB41553.1 flagellar motor switch protein FliM [Acutalibacter muris]MCI9192076.1 flagellar motor switch protein FliM [Acutalibacter muris]MCI9543616.1 flagellar motor switch protein FliM [Acutalibacter muris]QQR30814.1 flagellar motor switch protein FliM [Acutalibacter muris]
MPEVLSQSQIDALLNSMNSGGAGQAPAEEEPQEKKYRKYDFSSPRKFTKDRLKMLNSIFDNYSRVLTTRINGLVHATCEISVESVEEQRYFEFSNALSDSAVLTTAHLILKEEMEDTPVLFYASAPIMVSMMDRMTGGNGDVDSLPDEYTYTELDLKLFEVLMKDFISMMGVTWENYIQLEFEFGRVENNPTLVQLIGLEETVVLIDMKVAFSNVEGSISVVLPEAVLSEIFTQINAGTASKRSSEDNSEEIFDNLRESTLEIRAELARTTLRLDDVYRLNVGDVIDLNQKKDSTLNLYVGGQRWFNGLMGVSDKKLAVKIKEVYHNAGRRDRIANEQ